jgi:hypothetical protein
MSRLQDVILRDTRALQPAAAIVAIGSLYYVTDEDALERSNGAAWEAMSVPGGATPAWGGITGALSAQADLVAEFALKPDLAGSYADPAWITSLAGAKIIGTVATATAAASATLAAAATVLATPRTINGVAFDGSGNITVPADAGTLTGATLAAGVTASSLTSVGTLLSLASGLVTVTIPNVVVSQAAGLILDNATVSTGAVPEQRSPILALRSHVWNTAADTIDEWQLQGCPATAAQPGARLAFRSKRDGAAAIVALDLIVNTVGFFVNYKDTTVVGWAGRALSSSPADGQVNWLNQAMTSGVGFDLNTDGVLKVRTRAQSAFASIEALTVTATAFVGPVAGNASTATLAAAATVLATPRTINGVSFDGSANITVTAAAATLTGALLDATLSANVPLKNATNVFSVVQTITKDALVLVSTDALVLQNTTAATAAVPQQASPRVRFRSNVWNTTSAANNTDDIWIESVPVNGATPTSLLRFQTSRNAGAATNLFVVDSAGLLTVNNVTASNNVTAALVSTPLLRSGGGDNANIGLLGTGLFTLNRGTGPTGVGLNVQTDGVLKVRTRAHTGYAAVDALGYQISGVAIDTEPVGFFDAGNSGAALTLDFANGRKQRLVLTGNVTLTLSNPVDGARYLLHVGTGAGAFTATWPAAVLWAGGVAPVITAAAGKVDLVVLIYSATTGKYYGAVSQAY